MADPRTNLVSFLTSKLVPHRFLAAQLRRPSGRFGRLVMTRGLDDGNAELIDAVLDRLDLARHHTLLDVGFGGGRALRRAAEQTDGSLWGADFSPDVVLAGVRRHEAWVSTGRLNLVVADVADLPFRDQMFDRIVTTNTIYFWPDLAAALEELRRVLAPGGHVAFGYSGRAKMDEFGEITRHGFRTFEPEDLEEPLRAAGFDEVDTTSLDGRVTRGDFVTVARR